MVYSKVHLVICNIHITTTLTPCISMPYTSSYVMFLDVITSNISYPGTTLRQQALLTRPNKQTKEIYYTLLAPVRNRNALINQYAREQPMKVELEERLQSTAVRTHMFCIKQILNHA